MVKKLVKRLNSLSRSGYQPAYDVSGITDPFLQVLDSWLSEGLLAVASRGFFCICMHALTEAFVVCRSVS